MNFALYRIVVQPSITAQHIILTNAMNIIKKIMQTINFYHKTSGAGCLDLRLTRFAFLIGIGVDNQHGAIGFALSLFQSSLLARHIVAMCLGKSFKIKMIVSVGIG